MRLPRVPRVAWIAIVAVVVGLESTALVNDSPGDTFSALVWDVLAAVPVLALPIVGFLGWLAWHFVEPALRRVGRTREEGGGRS